MHRRDGSGTHSRGSCWCWDRNWGGFRGVGHGLRASMGGATVFDRGG